jgi:hypothetical protein
MDVGDLVRFTHKYLKSRIEECSPDSQLYKFLKGKNTIKALTLERASVLVVLECKQNVGVRPYEYKTSIDNVRVCRDGPCRCEWTHCRGNVNTT